MPKLTAVTEPATYMLLHGYYLTDFKPAYRRAAQIRVRLRKGLALLSEDAPRSQQRSDGQQPGHKLSQKSGQKSGQIVKY